MADGWVIDPANPNRATFKAPDGTIHEAFRQAQPEAPDTEYRQATPEELSVIKGGTMGPAKGTEAVASQPRRSVGDYFDDAFNRAISYAGEGETGAALRGWEDLLNLDDRFQQSQMGGTPQQRETYRDQVRADKVRKARSLFKALDDADPAWRKDGTVVGNVTRFLSGLAGDIVGNTNPDYLIGGGATLAERMAVQGATNAGVDAALQGVEMNQGIQDDFDPLRMAEQFLAGTVIQAGGEGLGKFVGMTKDAFNPRVNLDFDSKLHPEETITGELSGGPGTPTAEEDFAQELSQAIQGGADQEFLNGIADRYGKDRSLVQQPTARTPQEEDLVQGAIAAAAEKEGLNTPEDIQAALGNEDFQKRVRAEINDAGGATNLLDKEMAPDVAPTATQDIEIQQFRPKQEAPVSKDDVVSHIAEKTQKWKNAPDFEVVETVDQIADPAIRESVKSDPDIIGFYGPDGKVRIVSNNLQSKEEIAPALFHEALGHHGLTQKFGQNLDSFLQTMYDKSPEMRKAVDEWRADYGQGYGDVPLSTQVEEVLAKMSEGGELRQSLTDKIKDFLKNWARRAGLDLEYSDREIRSILASAHDAVTRGQQTAEAPSGARFIKVYHVSPADFDKFDSRFEGTGEGAQAYGKGHYFTESPDVRDSYRDFFTKRETALDGEKMSVNDITAALKNRVYDNNLRLTDSMIGQNAIARGSELVWTGVKMRLDTGKAPTVEELLSRAFPGNPDYWRHDRGLVAGAKLAVKELEKADISASKAEPKTYEVELPDDGKWVNRDEPISKQPLLREMFENDGFTFRSADQIDDIRDRLSAAEYEVRTAPTTGDAYLKAEQRAQELRADLERSIPENLPADQLENFLADHGLTDSQVAAALKDAGFTGFKYKDGFSRSGKKIEPTHNYVVFDDDVPKITNKYSKRRDSEASRTGERLRLSTTNVKRGASPANAAKTFLNELGVFNNAELMNMPGKEAIDRAARLGVDQDWLDYYNDARWNPETKTTDTPTPRPDMSRYLPDAKFMKRKDDSGRVGNIDMNKVFSRNDIFDAVEKAAEGYNPKAVTHDETVEAAKALGLTPSQVAKRRNVSTDEASAYIVGAMDVLARQAETVSALKTKVLDGDASPKDVAALAKATAVLGEIVPAVMKTRSDVGRALNAMRINYRRGKEAEEILKALEDMGGSAIFSDPALVLKFAKQLEAVGDDPVKMAKLAKDAFSPRAEDLVFSLWYNIDLLSRPSTQYNNFMGTLENVLFELGAKTLALPAGQIRKMLGSTDRVAIREVLARIVGAGLGALEGIKNGPEAFRLAMPVTGMSKEQYRPAPIYDVMSNLTKNAPPAVRVPTLGAAGALEMTSRVMAMADEFFRAVAHNSEKYGQAVREALKDNGPETFAEKVYRYSQNPTEERIPQRKLDTGEESYKLPENKVRWSIYDEAKSQSDIATLRDMSSPIMKRYEDVMRPKPDDGIGARTGRLFLRVVVPFARMGDAMTRSKIRMAPIIGFLDRYNKADWAAGGARRDVVVGRMTIGLGLGMLAATQVLNGERSGNGPADYERRKELEDAGWKPNAIRLADGSWESKQNLGPVNTYMNAIASLTEKLANDELSEEAYSKQATKAFSAVMASFVKDAGMENLVTLVSGDTEDSAVTNALGGLFSSFAIPGALQSYNQNYSDKAIRSAVPADAPAAGKDRTLEQIVEGRVKSAYPGYSEELPQKYDIYGRPKEREGGFLNMLTGGRYGLPEKDPTVLELQRLAAGGKKALIDQPEKTLTLGSGDNKVSKKLTEGEFQKYVGLSGYYLREIYAEQMKSPEYKKLSDDEKRKLVKEVKKFARKAAREYLFIERDDEPEQAEEPYVEEEAEIE